MAVCLLFLKAKVAACLPHGAGDAAEEKNRQDLFAFRREEKIFRSEVVSFRCLAGSFQIGGRQPDKYIRLRLG